MRQNFNLNKKRREEAKKKKREEKIARRLGQKAVASSADLQASDPSALPDAPPGTNTVL